VIVAPLTEPNDLPEGRGWRLDFDGEVHRVLVGAHDWLAFEVDGLQYRLPRLGYAKTRAFDLNGHPASVTHRFKAEPVGLWIRRQSAGRNIVLATFGFLISAGLGGGIVAGSLKERRMLSRFELTVDGRSAGTWATKFDAQGSSTWEFVERGDPLPGW
jgi:hypothetical protein